MHLRSNSVIAPRSATRLWLKVSLAVAGALAGAVFGVVLTKLGKIVAGAPPATFDNYLWNAAVFGVLAGGVLAILVGIPVLILIGPPAGLALGFLRLRERYPEPNPLPRARTEAEE